MTFPDSKSESQLPWYVWILAWISTSIMGGVAGSLFFLSQGANLQGITGGAGVGAYFAAFVGVIVLPLLAIPDRLFRFRQRASLRLLAIGGGLTGLLSGIVLGPYCVFTCALGAFGASLPGKWLRSQNSIHGT